MNLPQHSSWQGSIRIDDDTTINDIELHCPSHIISHLEHAISPNASLRFLSLVDVNRIPLHLMTGPTYAVSSYDEATEAWFRRHLLANNSVSPNGPWWETARLDSLLGVLVAGESAIASATKSVPRITEILFYATRAPLHSDRPPTPPGPGDGDQLDQNAARDAQSISVRAIGLSSDLYHPKIEPTPPSSPAATAEAVEAIFLPPRAPLEPEPINEPPVRKRKTVTDALDEAAARRKQARRHGGESVAAAAALKREDSLPTLKHRRSTSASIIPLQPRPLSRSPSTASTSRPGTARAPSEAPKRSSLLHVQNATPGDPRDPTPTTTETKNKDLISRTVMAGLRLHGLSQRRTPNHPHVPDAERQANEDYKLLYHHVYKGTCFAFRRHLAVVSLRHAHAEEALRETVERLLGIYCRDPLEEAGRTGVGGDEGFTPGGRKAFGSGVQGGGE